MNENRWRVLRTELSARLKNPIRSPEFVIYFVVVILLIGLMGVGLTFVTELKMTQDDCNHQFSHIHVCLAIVSYFIALLTASAADLILSSRHLDNERSSNDSQSISAKSNHKPLKMIGVGAILLGLVILLCVMFFENLLSGECRTWMEYSFSVIGFLLSLFIWWISNSDNPNLIPYEQGINDKVQNLMQSIE